MKVLKKIINVILKILILILFLIFTFSFIIQNVVTSTIAKDIMAKKIENYILDEIVLNYDSDKLTEINNSIIKSNSIEKITSKYISVISNNLTNNLNEELDISSEISHIIEVDLKGKITDDEAKSILTYLNEKTDVLENTLERTLLNSFGSEVKNFIKLYYYFTSTNLRLISAIGIVLTSILVYLMEKEKLFKSLQVIVSIVEIISISIFIIVKIFSNVIEQKLSGGWINTINLRCILFAIIFEFILNLFLVLIYDKLKSKKEDNSVVERE